MNLSGKPGEDHLDPGKGRDPLIVWLWDAPGPIASACGIDRDPDAARQAASAHLATGTAAVATVQAAALVSNLDATHPCYARFGPVWQAARISDDDIRWDEQAVAPAIQPSAAQGLK
jgi:hypothetical protein